MYTAVRMRLPKQMEDTIQIEDTMTLSQNYTEESDTLYIIVLGSTIPGGTTILAVFVCVLSCCCKKKCAQRNTDQNSKSMYTRQ